MKNLLLIILSLAALALAGCESTPQWKDLSADRGQKVILEVTGSPPQLDIRTGNGRNCKGKGCLNSPKNATVQAGFSLYESPDWHFSRFEICLGSSKSNRVCDLDVFQRLEFAAVSPGDDKIVLADDEGVINLLGLGSDLDEFIIANQNSARQDYYYRVQVCSNTMPGTCLWNEDPEWPNRGRGR